MTKIVHVCIEVSDLERASAFYRDAFDMEAVERHDGVYRDRPYSLVYLRDDESPTEIELLSYHDADLSPPSRRDNHFALVVDDLAAHHARLSGLTDDIDPSLTDHLVGGKVLGRYFFVRDPDGNAIEVMQRMGRYL